jgi:hypothetical protein
MLIRFLLILTLATLLACTAATLVYAQSVSKAPTTTVFVYSCEAMRKPKGAYSCSFHIPQLPGHQRTVMSEERKGWLVGYVVDRCNLGKLVINTKTDTYRYTVVSSKCPKTEL